MQSRRLITYSVLLGGLASAFINVLDWGAFVVLVREDWQGLLSFVVLAAISQAMAVDSIVGAAKPVKSSISFLPLLAMAVVYPPTAVVVAAGGMVVVSEVVLRADRVWHRGLFNVSQAILAYGAGGWVFHRVYLWTTGQLEFAGGSDFVAVFLPFYCLAGVFFGLNLLFVGIGVSIRENQPVLPILQEAAGKGGGNLLYDLLASPVALAAAYLYVNFDFAGLVLVVLPLLLIRHSYLSAIQLQKANRDLLQVLIKAIETRDPYTSGHSLRVSTLARMIAEDMGLRSKTVSDIETAALLHDIGKIEALYAEIIAKDAPLTEEERGVIKTHATKGADLLRSLTSLDRDIIIGVRHHHERYDGTGYPDGLSSKSIPLAARIIMLCDSIDAMLSDRPYRRALPVSEVRSELVRCSGTQFDPDIVTAILRQNTLERATFLVQGSSVESRFVAVAG
jgi:putative nucleotidyltransferase with HDIG domain